MGGASAVFTTSSLSILVTGSELPGGVLRKAAVVCKRQTIIAELDNFIMAVASCYYERRGLVLKIGERGRISFKSLENEIATIQIPKAIKISIVAS